MSYRSILLLTLILVPLNKVLAKSIQTDSENFSAISHQVKTWGAAQSTLVVMDNDDTLTMMNCPDHNNTITCQYLGGAAWFTWQQAQIENKSEPRVADNVTDLIAISGLIFSLSNMEYTAEQVPKTLNELSKKGVRFLVETARGNGNVSATERQFSQLLMPSSISLQSFIKQHSLVFSQGNIASKPSPFEPCADEKMRPITYQNGVMYLAGQDKGKNLKCLVKKYNEQQAVKTKISHIIFIDDTLKNVKSVASAFKNSKEYTVNAIHYTALAKHKLALTKGSQASAYQQAAMNRWYKIKSTLELSLLNPALP
ncbi:DUF2608 domain-containing protein [Thalassotalea sp. PLHSN55]|uniref:DUF2608 domain-containing protein n=1 Tax=Thalassotalea sp. PLHSN55 TaxID=3435888 RepID=UPI003F87F757